MVISENPLMWQGHGTTAAKMGLKDIQNAIPEHLWLVENNGNGYCESQLFYLSFLIQVN